MATEFTQTSGFSIAQIKDATQMLVSILQDDKVLAPLYESARRNPNIGVKKLRRQVRQSIETYAENLRNEATDYLSFSASRLVRARANYAARCVASQEIQERQQQPLNKLDQIRNEAEESSEDDGQEQPGQERDVGDLVAFRSFLIESTAYATFRVELETFCLAQPDPLANAVVTCREDPGSDIRSSAVFSRQPLQNETAQEPCGRMLWASYSATIKEARAALSSRLDQLYLAMGYLEPPLEEGWTRIRSQCCCGDRFFDDVYEQAEGGVATLVEKMHCSSANLSITVVPYSSRSPNQQYSLRSPTWLRMFQSKLLAVFPGYGVRSNALPYHNAGNPGPIASGTDPGNQQQQQNTLHLMSCVHRSRDHTILLQDDISPINNDSALFSFLKARIPRRRNRLLQILSCRTIEGIYFSKFRLRLGDSVEVRHHNPCCQSSNPSICECIPPDYKLVPSGAAEYSCRKTSPPGTWPLVGPSHLAHMLKCPLQINEKQIWIFNLVPKRNWGELSGRPDEPAEGWGFYFEEGWDFDVVVNIAFVVFMLASLLFGVLWTVLKSDIQGAFGVSSYIVTLSGLVIAFAVRQAGKMD
ncbi:hypothetical protein PtrSN002B_002616 [Pyrenophora tritici-repentis]|uniref:Uncharacterized protein n=1 Tax=Pyrenophora tritici-repentis TaxID=45151 RepID=A0A2W1F8E0_9PLEO|nr:hypothetical protein PtrV1_02052 [Pyrenophora tritici-repentis]KAF7454790.1 hypothetical protein A1F99_020480 [Pyrenophora tritici-repentis]KAF7577922.1 hypothetical protein PtrM4_021620 [Pyrenophora tritici-repentis]KAI0583399.1 hypothetical protein Alg215_03631 [Pyrenophora tritici-repentis]KAI1543650.1 hypothetical protein PtrSN001A_003001 [Pyrenophora tritici-repentis]